MGSVELRPGAPGYPTELSSWREPPPLFVRGALPAGRGVAIVGTREATREASELARTIAAELAREGVVVWSGGARGIDAAAHEGALDAGGTTVVVSGAGLAHPYPPEHAPLFARVVEAGGALVARVPDHVRPQPFGFLLRNEVLAALTYATVVVEAGVRSGARSTAAAARKLGRPLLVVPHAPWSAHGAGCALELARGARAVTCAGDVLSALEGAGRAGAERDGERPFRSRRSRPKKGSRGGAVAPPPPDLSPEERAVCEALDGRPGAATPRAVHLDELSEMTGLPSRTVQGALLTLTLKAVVVEGPAGFFRRVRCS